MAIVFDSKAVNETGADFAFTNTSGNFMALYVVGALGSDNVTGANYNGVAMTLVTKVIDATDRSIYMFRLVSPATGSNTVAITLGSGAWVHAYPITYSGVDTTTPITASATKDEAGVISQSQSVVTTIDNSWVIGFFHTNATKTFTPDSGTTNRQADSSTTGAASDSNGPITPAGSSSLGYTYNTSAAFAECIVAALAPGAAVVSSRSGYSFVI